MLSLLEQIPVSPFWQKIIGAIIIALLTFITVVAARFILNIVLKKITVLTKSDLDDKLVAGTQKQIYLLIYLFGLTYLFDYLQALLGEYLGVKIFSQIDSIFYAVGVLLVTTILIKVFSTIFQWYGQSLSTRLDSRVDDELVPLLDRATKIILYVLSILIILDHFDIDIKGMITVLGVGSLAVALAAQETIANMIGGFIIMIDRPFRTGDWVNLSDGTICKAHQIGVRSTKFLTLENSLIIVPNAELVKTTIHNITYPYPELRIRIDVGVSYEADIEQVKQVMLDEASKHPDILKSPPPFFRFFEFGDSSLNVTLFCRVPKVDEQFRVGSELREQILIRFRKENIEIPFPQRVVTFVNKDENNKSDNTNKKD